MVPALLPWAAWPAKYPCPVSDTRPLTDRQAERRERVLRAAIDLAAEGGYDGVQMRAVAERADVALGTVYHYFSSKDHLLAESLSEWLDTFRRGVEANPAQGETTLDRVLDLLGRTIDAMGAFPRVTAALISGFVAEGEEVAVCQEALHVTFAGLMGTAFPDGFPTADQARIIRSLEHVWFSALIGWKNDWLTYERASADLEDAARMLLAGRA